MKRSSGPVWGGGDPWTDLLLFAALCTALLGFAGSLWWMAASLASLITGHGVGPGLIEAARLLLAGRKIEDLWPGVPVTVTLTVLGGQFAVLMAVVVIGAGWWQRTFPARDGYARPGQLAELVPGRDGTAKARRLRPALQSSGRLPGGDLGVPIGRLRPRGPVLRASWEDVVLAICAPRSGKTTCLAVPAVLDAPGPVVATSNKPDLWLHTHAVRASQTGQRAWTFDPQQITRGAHGPGGFVQGFCWAALAGIDTVADARRFAGHFVQEIRRVNDHHGGGGDFWDRDAEDLLAGLILAAAVDGRTLTDVGTWLTSVSSVEPRNILARGGFTQLADVMAGRSQGAHETREGVYATARAAAACLSDPQIMGWVTPRPDLDVFDPAEFVTSRQTLYLLSKDGAGSAAPLIAAFADRIMLEAVRAAETSPGGRLDPPLVAVLDEAANICRITELPRLYSHLGSRGVTPITILQSRAQGQRVWGDGGMAELFSAATVKVIGAGIDDQIFAEDLSRMIGAEDVLIRTRNGGRHGGISVSPRRERVLPADEVRALPKFTGLLLVTGVRPARIRLVPWMDGPHATLIHAALSKTP